jgi:hypothetical protein
VSSRKTLKSVSVDGLKPTITLTPVVEPCGEGFRIHHIKSDSIARDGRDTFVPLRHVSKQKRRIFELETENDKLREICIDAHDWMGRALYDGSARRYEYKSITERMRELGVEAK